MGKVLFSLLALMLFFISCGRPSSITFNDALVKANAAISNISVSYQNSFAKAIESESYEDITALTDSTLVKIDQGLDFVKALKVPEGGAVFKATALKSYENFRDLVETSKKFATLTKESIPEDFDKIGEEYSDKFEEYSKSFDELIKVQMDYANEVGCNVYK